jgi:hypothetical protein
MILNTNPEQGEIFRAMDFEGAGISVAHRPPSTGDGEPCENCGEKHPVPGLTSIAIVSEPFEHPEIVVLTDDEAAALLSVLAPLVYGMPK